MTLGKCLKIKIIIILIVMQYPLTCQLIESVSQLQVFGCYHLPTIA